MTHDIVQGTSEPQHFELRDDVNDLMAAIDGTGFTVALEIVEKLSGAPPASPPTVAWLNQSAGTVTVSGVDALPVGHYLVRYKLTDGSGKIGFVPNGLNADLWRVVAPGYRSPTA